MVDTMQEDIHRLLSEGRSAAIEREKKTFSQLMAPFEHRLVLFGAGAIGYRTACGLQSLGIQPLAFADHVPALWGKEMANTVILSAEEAVARFRNTAGFVVTLPSNNGRSSLRDCVQFLKDVGCARACSFGPLYWKYADRFLPYNWVDSPHCVHEQATEVLEAAVLWDDDASRAEY